MIILEEGLYLKTIIEKQKNRFMYGYKISNNRLKSLLVDIPIKNDGNINWELMKKKILSSIKNVPVPPKTKNTLSKSAISLNDREWKQFRVGALFNVYSGLDLPKYNRNEGDIPFVGSSSKQNGVTDKYSFIPTKKQFSYGFKLGSERLKNLEINLPIDQNKKLDWQFMENYVKSLPNGDLL